VRLRRIMARALRPPALIGGLFLAVTASIAANALFLQSARHPAPFVATLKRPEPPAAPRRDGRVEAIQAALREAGYYSGPVDGIAGEQTEAAIMAYEQRLGWAPTGAASRDLLAAVQADIAARRAAGEAVSAAADAPEPEGDSRVAEVQEALAKAAYGPLKADGVFGRQTQEAIIRFQLDHGLTATGEINDALIVELRAAGALGGE
jgi:peptidoglycan hydrolase-like protein with peptidoglycan-binding domain